MNEKETNKGQAAGSGSAAASRPAQTQETTDAGAEAGAGEVRSSSQTAREEQNNQSAAKTARQIIDEATASRRDTGEAIKEACDAKVRRLARILGARSPRQ